MYGMMGVGVTLLFTFTGVFVIGGVVVLGGWGAWRMLRHLFGGGASGGTLRHYTPPGFTDGMRMRGSAGLGGAGVPLFGGLMASVVQKMAQGMMQSPAMNIDEGRLNAELLRKVDASLRASEREVRKLVGPNYSVSREPVSSILGGSGDELVGQYMYEVTPSSSAMTCLVTVEFQGTADGGSDEVQDVYVKSMTLVRQDDVEIKLNVPGSGSSDDEVVDVEYEEKKP